MSSLSSFEWQEDYRRERSVLDTRWQSVQHELHKVRARWDEVKRAEDRLEQDRADFERKRAEVIDSLSQQRATLVSEADHLTRRAKQLKDKEAEVLLLDRTVRGISERNVEQEEELRQHERRLQEREVLLNTLLQKVADQDARQAENFQRINAEISSAAAQRDAESTEQLQRLRQEAHERDTRLAERERLLQHNEEAFRRRVREAGSRHCDSFAASLLRSTDVAQHLSSSELHLYTRTQGAGRSPREQPPPAPEADVTQRLRVAAPLEASGASVGGGGGGSGLHDSRLTSPLSLPVTGPQCTTPDRSPTKVDPVAVQDLPVAAARSRSARLSPTAPDVSMCEADLSLGGGGGVDASSFLGSIDDPLVRNLLASELAASQQRVSQMAAQMSLSDTDVA